MRNRFAHLELESDFIDWSERMRQIVFSYNQRAILIARNNSTSSRQSNTGTSLTAFVRSSSEPKSPKCAAAHLRYLRGREAEGEQEQNFANQQALAMYA
jgi:hypothetical protein